MSSDWSVESAEDDYKEQKKLHLAEQAAIQIVDGETRSSAIDDVLNRSYEQEDAITKGNVLDTPELNDRSIPAGKEAQVKAIAAQIIEEFE
jgi:hypothetical protein